MKPAETPQTTPSTTQTQPIPTAIELAHAIRGFLLAESYWTWVPGTPETPGDFAPFDVDECAEKLIEPLHKLICSKVGHAPIMDHCTKPEHDYCLACGDRTPGQAERKSR